MVTLPLNRLFVGNLPRSIDSDMLREVFEEAGPVTLARVALRADGASRGFGFVEMYDDRSAAEAVRRFDGTDLGGRPVVVSVSKPRVPLPFALSPDLAHVLARGAIDDLLTPEGVEKARGLAEPTPEQIVEVGLDQRWRLRKVMDGLLANPELRFDLDDRYFEEFTAELFELDGYEVELTRKSKDGGIDLILRKSDHGGLRIIGVECKRYKPENRVGLAIVQRSIGYVANRCSNALVVTTSSFTHAAVKEAEERPHLLSLMDGKAYIDFIKDVRSSD